MGCGHRGERRIGRRLEPGDVVGSLAGDGVRGLGGDAVRLRGEQEENGGGANDGQDF